MQREEAPPSLPDSTSLQEAWLEHREHLADLSWRDYGMVQLAVLGVLRLRDLEDWEDVPATLGVTLRPLEKAREILDKLGSRSYARAPSRTVTSAPPGVG